MARSRFIFVHEAILQEETRMQEKFGKLQIDGRRTTRQTVKRIRETISDTSFKMARKFNVLVNWPKMAIKGNGIDLGAVSILLPSGRYVGYEELKALELGKARKEENGR